MYTADLRYFAAICEEGTLSAAAKKLHVSQPALSNYLTRLETSVGTDLFYRQQKKLRPTRAGQIYLNACRKIIEIDDNMHLSIHRLENEERSLLHIAATPYRGSLLFADIYPKFVKKFPAIDLKIHETYMADTREGLINGKYDVGFFAGFGSEDPDLRWIFSSKQEILLVVPAFHNAAVHAKKERSIKQVSLKDFSGDSFVLFSKGSNTRAKSDSLLAAAGISPFVAYESNNDLVILTMIEKGFGIGFLPASVVINDPDVVCFSLDPVCYTDQGMVLKKGKRLSEPLRYLLYLTMERDLSMPCNLSADSTVLTESVQKEFSMEEQS